MDRNLLSGVSFKRKPRIEPRIPEEYIPPRKTVMSSVAREIVRLVFTLAAVAIIGWIVYMGGYGALSFIAGEHVDRMEMWNGMKGYLAK